MINNEYSSHSAVDHAAADKATADVELLQQQLDAYQKRVEELLALVARISQETPLPDEIAGWEGQRAKLVAEVGTLRAKLDQIERERLGLWEPTFVTTDPGGSYLPLREMIHRYCNHVLQTCNGNKSLAARVLGMDRRSLYRWLEKSHHPREGT